MTIAVVALLVTSAVPFAVDVGSTSPSPVAFDDTVSVGLALENQVGLDDEVALPRAQVFYSQYEYVVGYYGVETFVDTFQQEGHQQRFGYPLAVYVTDYSGTDVELTDEGYPATDVAVGWTDAERAWFVVGSEATAPGGETVVPFSERADAEAFAETHGGDVLPWTEILGTEFDVDNAAVVRERVEEQAAAADERSAAADALLDRPTSVVVGEDADTVQAAVDAAPPNTTVVVPPGTYEETVVIDESITLAGENATIDGGGTGTVVEVRAERAAVTGLDVVGVGDTNIADEETDAGDEDGDWDESIDRFYGSGDAGVAVESAPGTVIEGVAIETPANGVLLRDSPGTVVRNVSVDGTDSWRDGYMGVLAIRSPGVIEDSTFAGGRDAVYLHRSHGIVVRDNEMTDGRFGVHSMFTSDALLAGNEFREQAQTGIYVMTGPEGNAIVGNTVRETETGIRPGGTDSYVARNVLEGNAVGLRTDASGTIYEHNVLADNEQGMQARSLLPTNRVVGNDFVGNDEHAVAGPGPLRIWTHDGHGNYWQGAVGTPDAEGGVLDRPYAPTDPVDAGLHRVDGTPTLAQAPAVDALAGFRDAVPGMRDGSIVDTGPTCGPNNPDLLATTDAADAAADCTVTPTDTEP
ncbi:NosD domain-containing protein [Salinilacihabitans rarus]|uniref:NosD domain-containing protein n=1 Tax=Salinilacihabitans rarus TaxID=2961596 RepID=UPI0020C86F77|nr:NosD domain-containing protein [Salinilacihabitans rarus]